MTIGDIIRDRRKALNMTQEDLAQCVNTTKATVSRWESGDIHKMKRPMMVALARTLQIDPMIFLQREEVLMPDEERLITAYRQASEEIKGAALAMLEELNGRADELEKKIAYHKMTDEKIIADSRIRFIMDKIADGKRDDPEYLKTIINVLVNHVRIFKHWLEVAINAVESTEQIPPEILPPLDVLPDGNRFEFRKVNAPSLYVLEPYPVIVFKIAI